MLEYDNSAFYYFCISLGVIYVVPITYFSLRRIIYGLFLKERLIDTQNIRCEKEKRKMKQLITEKTKLSNIFSPWFLLNLIVLIGMWIGLYHAYNLLQFDSEIKSFDPFAILGITTTATEKEIKRAYRKMSLLYHPDKNIGDAVADQKFMLVAKAYEALTDEVAKANYEKFGNPDGRQALQLSIGLPTFLLDPTNHNMVLFLYLIILVIAIPSCVALWYSHSKKYGDSMIMYDTYGFYNFAMSESAHPRLLPEVLAGSAEFREIPRRASDEAELGSLFKKLKAQDMIAKPRFNHPSIAKANILVHSHFLREKLSPPLKQDLNAMLKKSIQLIDGMLEISVMKSWLQTTLNLIEMQQFMTQSLWFKDPPFLQLPHLTEKEVKHIISGKNGVRSMHQYIDMPAAERKGLNDLSEAERDEVNRVCDMLPNMDLQITIGVEDEEEIAEGDIMTVTVKLTRKNVKEGDTCDLVYAPHFPYPKIERWFCCVGDVKANHLHAFAKVTSQERETEMKLQLQAPPKAGTYQLDIFVKCDSYIGLDLRALAKFNIVSASTLPVYQPHPEDLELDNEPTLFEQVMNQGDSSDSEAEDDAEPSTEKLADNEVERHELQTGWSFWEQREQSKGMSYNDKLSKLCTFKTVEEFWGYYNNLPKPSQVLFDGFTRKKFSDGRYVESFALFKEGIVPEWEDPANAKGGEWTVRKEIGGEALDECWERLVLGAIGEILDDGDEITGVRLIHKNKPRDKKDPGNNFRYEIWLRKVDRDIADEIRGRIVELMANNPGSTWAAREFSFKNH